MAAAEGAAPSIGGSDTLEYKETTGIPLPVAAGGFLERLDASRVGLLKGHAVLELTDSFSQPAGHATQEAAQPESGVLVVRA